MLLEAIEIDCIDEVPEIVVLSQKLAKHAVYRKVATRRRAIAYMESQVWCVWDFMTLMRSMQIGLTTNSIFWLPSEDTESVRYVYEILLSEETDESRDKLTYSSHFESYLGAMSDAGADRGPIDRFISALRSGKSFEEAIIAPDIPRASAEFVRNTIKHASGPLHQAVGVFCLSREGIIPDMFASFTGNIPNIPELQGFRWYIDRHVELDSSEHGPLCAKLFKRVVGDDKNRQREALQAAYDALQARHKLLDAILLQIESIKE